MREIKQTITVDDIECPYCGHTFDGSDAVNGDMDCTGVECPSCNKHMEIMISVEYMATSCEQMSTI